MPQKKAKLGPSSSQTSPPQHIGLLDSPAELRLEIYRHCFPRDKLVKATDWPPRFQVESAPGSETEDEDESEEEDEVDWEEEWRNSVCRYWGQQTSCRGGRRTYPTWPDRCLGSCQTYPHETKQCWPFCGVEANQRRNFGSFMYGENIFEVFLHGESTFREIFSQRNRRRMRHILVVARPPRF